MEKKDDTKKCLWIHCENPTHPLCKNKTTTTIFTACGGVLGLGACLYKPCRWLRINVDYPVTCPECGREIERVTPDKYIYTMFNKKLISQELELINRRFSEADKELKNETTN